MKKKSYQPSGSEVKKKTVGTYHKIDRTFAGIVRQLCATLPQPAGSRDDDRSAFLAWLPYELELQVKNKGLAQFWQGHGLPGEPEPIVASPRPRGYRTTSRRKAVLKGDHLYLTFGGDGISGLKKPFSSSLLEPPEHAEIYRFLLAKLSVESAGIVAHHLNHLVIRGGYDERIVIFNVDMMNGPLVRKLKIIAGQLQAIPGLVQAAFIYLDPSKSEYYLESRRPDVSVTFKRLFGPGKLAVSHDGCRYLYDPTSFSQVNESIVPLMLQAARDLLQPARGERLVDLYCGYGLFSHYLAPYYQEVVAVDAEGPSIRSAIATCKLNQGGGRRPKFLARTISGANLELILPPSPIPESIILDPPRQGTPNGVVESLGKRMVHKALHIFCGVDQIPVAAKEWQNNGYVLKRIVPLDMFPGSPNLEVLILFAAGDTGNGRPVSQS